MAENETLDLAFRNGGRWRKLRHSLRTGKSVTVVAAEGIRCLFQTFKSLQIGFDVFGDKAMVASIPIEELNYLKATVIQIEALSCVKPDQSLPLNVKTHLARVWASSESVRPSIDLLQQYRNEWLPLIDAGLKAGYQWARWHGPIDSESSARSVA